LSRLRAEFPVLDRIAFLNAGTNGPLPVRALEAARAEVEREVADGRTPAHFDRRAQLRERLRALYAQRLGCPPSELAVTTCTSEGIARVVAGLALGRGDEIVTSDEEHPGLLGPLQVARDVRGVRVRVVALAETADAVGPATRLVACSHVSWVTGAVAPAELAELDMPVLLDGAQGAGAVPVDVRALGCGAYAASGQKWLCGPDGTGLLHVSPALADRLTVIAASYASFEDANAGLDARLHGDARRHDAPVVSAEALAMAVAALEVLGEAGWETVHERARGLARKLAADLAERGHDVRPRGDTTLVAWRSEDAAATKDRLREAGVIVRDMPGRGLLRASVGAWNDESDLERLLDALAVEA
jgi:L-cysteine/cystine lyase